MTSRRKDGSKSSRQASVEDVVWRTIDALRDTPSVVTLTLLGLLRNSMDNLRRCVEKGRVGISWKNPLVELRYEYSFDLAIGEERGEELPDVYADEADIHKAFLDRLPQYLELGLLRVLTQDVRVHVIPSYTDEDAQVRDYRVILPDHLKAKLDALPDEERTAKLDELVHGAKIPGLSNASGSYDTPDGPRTFEAIPVFEIRPLTVDRVLGLAYFPILVGFVFTEGDPTVWTKEQRTGFWRIIFQTIDELTETLLKELDAAGVERPKIAELPKPDQTVPVRRDFDKIPGRMFDTPRHIVAQGKQKDLPEIGRWYMQTAFTRTVGMAAAALTNTKTRDDILGWQSATVEEVEDLVFCRSEEGTPAHGQHREDILKAFEALRAIPVPIVRIDWKQIGSSRHPHFAKEYRLRVASMLQSYGAVFVDRETGRKVLADDVTRKKDLVKSKADRRKTMRELIKMNPIDSILLSFPADRYKLTGFEWRWNTDVAEDFICPEVALDQKNRPRLKQKKGRHHEGSRFINLNRRYFAVQKHLREARSTYAPRLLDLIVSEKSDIKSRSRGAVWIEIQAAKVIKYLGLWDESQMRFEQGKLVGVSRVLEERIAPAIQLLIDEKVILAGSDTRPRKDRNPDRRKGPYYRWKVAELFSTVALVPDEEAKVIEAEIIAKAVAEEQAKAEAPPPEPPKPVQGVLPGMEFPPPAPVPSGSDIRAAREAAGMNLRRFAEAMDGPNFSTWSRYESGNPIRVGSIQPDTWQRVADFVAQHKPKGDPDGGKAGS